MSKGDKRRPTDDKRYKEGWERTFEKRPEKKYKRQRREGEVRWRHGGGEEWTYENEGLFGTAPKYWGGVYPNKEKDSC